MRRLILILADGLRPDAITPSHMPSLDALGHAYTMALRATTVRPSATVAALASLATGVGPETHRLIEPGLGFLARLGGLRPVAWELSKAGIPTDVVTTDIEHIAYPIVWTLATAAGVRKVHAGGAVARHAAERLDDVLDRTAAGMVFVYLPDCDRAGHAHGWMSPEYLQAAAQVDAAIGVLAARAEDALVMVLADHGGGGVTPTDHDEPHPTNDHIPLVLAGRDVTRRHRLTRRVSLLDVPPTALWWFGIEAPAGYEGRPLVEAFTPERELIRESA